MTAPLHWQKKGLVFTPSGQGGWMTSHAQVPTALKVGDEILMFFAARPKQSLSLPALLVLDANDPTKMLCVHDKALLDVGAPGTFDQHGVMPSCVLEVSGKLWMYYSGWCREVDVPYNNTIGLAVSSDGGESFTRLYEGPVVGRSRVNPYNASSPYVIHEDGIWHMWYSSGTRFYKSEKGYQPVYVLRYAHSTDGIDWVLDERDIIPTLSADEAQTRPTVMRIDGIYHMWFCYRGSEDYHNGSGSYRMGYAHSTDGVNWQRDDAKAGIDVSADGWDSKMIAYPYVIALAGGRYAMFYNGNDFGREGFGLALAST